MGNYWILISMLVQSRLYRYIICDLRNLACHWYFIKMWNNFAISDISNKSRMHPESSWCLLLHWKMNLTWAYRSKNSHLAFIWFIFSLKQPCKCIALFLHFIPKVLWESRHRISYYLFDLCISVHFANWAWSRTVYLFIYLFCMGTSKEWKEVIAGQYALSEGTTRDCIFFSFIGQYMDSICHRNNVAHLYCTYSSVELKALYGHSH